MKDYCDLPRDDQKDSAEFLTASAFHGKEELVKVFTIPNIEMISLVVAAK